MNPILIEAPAVEPVTLAAMRAYLRLDDGAEDEFVAALIKAARQAVESASGRLLIAQTWRYILDRWPDDRIVVLPLSPLITVDSIRVFDDAGQTIIVAPELYHIDATSDPPRILIDAAAPVPRRRTQGVEIDLRMGFGTGAEAVPDPLIQAIRLLVARWFERRGDEAESAPLPPDIAALVGPFRRLRI
jgi:uncharacterized phiE125 gp8 family phage protein